MRFIRNRAFFKVYCIISPFQRRKIHHTRSTFIGFGYNDDLDVTNSCEFTSSSDSAQSTRDRGFQFLDFKLHTVANLEKNGMDVGHY